MSNYVACVPLGGSNGNVESVVARGAPTVSEAIREVCTALNAGVAANGGYRKVEGATGLSLMVFVFEAPDDVRGFQVEMVEDSFRVLVAQVLDEDKVKAALAEAIALKGEGAGIEDGPQFWGPPPERRMLRRVLGIIVDPLKVAAGEVIIT